jgi:hypothetical protein
MRMSNSFYGRRKSKKRPFTALSFQNAHESGVGVWGFRVKFINGG